MQAKFLVVLLIAVNCYSSVGQAALRKTPKIYNALITTDENLTSSRAYPVIQPTLHETGIAHYPFSPYGVYSPLVRFGQQPLAPGLASRPHLPYPLPQSQFPPQLVPRPLYTPPQSIPGYPQIPPTAPAGQQDPQEVNPQQPTLQTPEQASKPSDPQIPKSQLPQNPNGKSPSEQIPLNEYGLPPALIPLPHYPNQPTNRQQNNLPLPYGFNQRYPFPLLYDPATGYRQQFLLPPYNYFPTQTLPEAPKQPTLPPTPPFTQTTQNLPENETQETTDLSTDVTEPVTPSFDDIKNGSKSKNSDIPDVLPPVPPSKHNKQS